MERTILPKGINADQERILNYIIDGAFPIPSVVSSNPVASDLKEGQTVFSTASTRIYLKINGNLYYITLTSV